MRWLFLFVLLVNVAYVTWEMGKSPDEGRVIKKPTSHIPPLVLISEMEPTINEVVESVDKAEEVKVAKVEVVVAVEKVEIKAKTAVVKAEVAEKVNVETSPVVKPPKKTPEKPKPLVDACYTLGPFRELNKLRVFTRKIKNYVVDVSFRSREEQEISLFWVYLAPEADSKAAHKLSKRLISKKIKDYYIITSGEKRNGVSLGHFKDKVRASSHAKRLKKLGFNPVVETVFRTYVIYWLDYKNKQGQPIPDEIFKKHMTNRMNKLNRECI